MPFISTFTSNMPIDFNHIFQICWLSTYFQKMNFNEVCCMWYGICMQFNKVPSQSKGLWRHRIPVARILNKNPWTYCTSISFTFITLKNKNSWTYCTSITFTLLRIFWKRKNYYVWAICSRVFKYSPKYAWEGLFKRIHF